MLQTGTIGAPVIEAKAEEGHYLAVKGWITGQFDFGGVSFAGFESLESFEVKVICGRKYAAWVFHQVELQLTYSMVDTSLNALNCLRLSD